MLTPIAACIAPSEPVAKTIGPGCSLVVDTHDDRGAYVGINFHYTTCPAPSGATQYTATDPVTGLPLLFRVVWDVS